MKNILKSICWLLLVAEVYYLIKTLITDSMDMEIYYGIKTILFTCIIQMILFVEKKFE